jgi:hypothetical protein
MRLYAYVLTAALCAGTAGAALAQVPGNTGATLRFAGASQVSAGRQVLRQTSTSDVVGRTPSAAWGVPVTRSSASSGTSAVGQAPNANLQALVQEHAVITSDDLAAMKFSTAEVFIPTEFTDQPAVDPALCNAGCEVEARAAAGMDHVRDSEWKSQFQAARMDLAADRRWGQAYADGMRRLHSYCVFQDQAKNAFLQGRNEASQAQRTQWAQYVGEMNQSLGGGVDSSAARIEQDIQQAQRQDSVRAAIMEVLAEKAFSQCSVSTR